MLWIQNLLGPMSDLLDAVGNGIHICWGKSHIRLYNTLRHDVRTCHDDRLPVNSVLVKTHSWPGRTWSVLLLLVDVPKLGTKGDFPSVSLFCCKVPKTAMMAVGAHYEPLSRRHRIQQPLESTPANWRRIVPEITRSSMAHVVLGWLRKGKNANEAVGVESHSCPWATMQLLLTGLFVPDLRTTNYRVTVNLRVLKCFQIKFSSASVLWGWSFAFPCNIIISYFCLWNAGQVGNRWRTLISLWNELSSQRGVRKHGDVGSCGYYPFVYPF